MSVATQFGLSHGAYRQFRPSYPTRLYERVLDQLGSRRERAVDLGAGTGLVSAVLVEHFEQVIAVEPDAGMAAHVRETAPGAVIRTQAAEQVVLEPRSVDLVTCANAFHWMNGPAVAAAVTSWLREGGLFAGWRYPMPSMPAAIEDLVRDELRRWLAHADPRGLDMRGMQTSFAAQPEIELLADEVITNPVTMSVEGLIGFLRSVSFVAAFLCSLPPPEAETYVETLGARVHERLGDASVVLDFPLTLVLARRRPARGSEPRSPGG